METRQRDFQKENMVITLVLWVLLCGISMTAMVRLSAHKAIVIADVTQGQTGLSTSSMLEGQELMMFQTQSSDRVLKILLPADVRAENVVMENRYMERQLWVHIQSDDTKFYETTPVNGDVSAILDGRYEIQSDGVLLKFAMDSIKEYHSTMEGNILRVESFQPKELYSFIVVIDPVGGGSDAGLWSYGYSEKELSLQIARQVQKDFNLSDVKLYLTRTEDVEVSEEDRIKLIQEVGADLYIGIGAAEYPEDESVYGIQCYYNEDFFIPDFGNVELADITTKAVTIASSNRAVGLMPAEQESILREINVPAIKLSVGYLSNDKERNLLQQENYQDKVAWGILNAIEESCSRLKELQLGEER